MPDVSENYSSLREAVNRILGQPAGGTQQQGQGGFDLAPKPSYSSDLGNIATDATISNTPYDPYAEQNAADAASLAAIKAETAALTAPTAAASAEAPAAAVSTAPVSTAPALWKGYQEYFSDRPEAMQYTGYKLGNNDPGVMSKMNWGKLGNPYRFAEEYGRYLKTLPAEYQVVAGTGISPDAVRSGAVHSVLMGNEIRKIPGADYYQSNPVSAAQQAATTAAAAPAAALTKPVNPGPRAPWQASQQYWKDLEAYQKAGGK